VINRLVIENLKHRRLRTGLSALSIGFQVTMILAVVGLSNGMLQDSIDRAKGVGADIAIAIGVGQCADTERVQHDQHCALHAISVSSTPMH